MHQVHVSRGRPDDAERAARQGIARAERDFARSGDNPRPAYLIATTLAKLGETARVEAWANRALAIAPDDYLTQYNIACFHAVLGQADSAFAILDRLLPRSNAEMKEWMLGDSDLTSLHDDPRWQRLSKRAATATG